MSAPNFYYNNVLYATKLQDELDYEDLKNNIIAEIEADRFLKNRMIDCGDTESLELRSYFSEKIAEIYLGTNKYDTSLHIEVVIRGGYYADANIDYNIIYTDGWGTLSDGENIYCDEYLIEMGKKREEELSKTLEKLEKIFSMCSDKLNHEGTFSNGEAVYSIAT